MIVGGRAVRSCGLPLPAVAGAAVETVERLGAADGAHTLVAAILRHQAGQCGYCLPGILMAAKALLDAEPQPDDAAVRAALVGILCRCGAHLRILRAIGQVARGVA